MSVGEFLDMLEAFSEHYLVIYDDEIVGDDSDNFGDLLYDSNKYGIGDIPDDILRYKLISFDIEEDVLRLWVSFDW